jgi:serine/threonine protein phosphatase 1
MTSPIYAVGDIHGQHAELERILDLIDAEGGRAARVIFLGDYIDRGPDSRAVIETLIRGREEGRNWEFIKGNHDRMFDWFMEDPPRHDSYLPAELYWLHPRLGGDTTLGSYGVRFTQRDRLSLIREEAGRAVPPSHVSFMRETRLSIETERYYFCHAGIRPGVPLRDQSEQDRLWIRRAFHKHEEPHPKLIVHGHTPIDGVTHYGNRINLDTGAGNGERLSAIVLEAEEAWALTEGGRQRLTPS